VAVGPLPDRVQLLDGVKEPGPLLVQVTVPVGVRGVPGEVSVTLDWHVVECPGCTKFGEQLTLVDVERCVTVKPKPPELPEWSLSPG